MVFSSRPAEASHPVRSDQRSPGPEGVDPMSSFDGQPLVGRPDLSSGNAEVAYRFASNDKHRHFKADPARFLPQVGGFCAVAAAEGRWAQGDLLPL